MITFKEFLNERTITSKTVLEYVYGEKYPEGIYVGSDEDFNYFVSGSHYEARIPLTKAKEYCESLSTYDHSDWYLPKRQELKLAMSNPKAQNVFVNTWVWCDNGLIGDTDIGIAYSPHSDTANKINVNKSLGVRPFRKEAK